MSAAAHGSVALFTSPEAIIEAAKKAKEKGFKNWDTYTPFPIHGMDDIQGLGNSIVPWATFFCGAAGFTLAHALQIWMSAIDWPLNIGGKPFISYPAFIPIIFELTVLLGGLGTAAFMFFLNGLPNSKPPIDPRITDDRFALYVSYEGSSESEVEGFLNGLGAEKVSKVMVEV